jgi:putative peptidoglycan lipid II flippase
MAPALIGLSAVQANALVDQAMAFYLVAPGANTYVYLANRLLLFPHALTSLALATAVFPSLAVLGSDDDRRGLRTKLDGVLTGSLFLALPAALGLVLIAGDLVSVLFQHGEFTAEDTQQTHLATVLLVIGLPFVGSVQLHARAFYALGDMSTPARIAMRLLLVNLGLNLIFVLGTDLGAAGLTLATSLSAVANAAILRAKLRRICPRVDPLTRILGRCVLATAAMGVAVWLVRDSIHAEGTLERVLFDLGLPILTGVLVYGLAHWLLGSPELGRIRRPG